ncbi:hypothetical protein DD509_02815 [Dehalogenimonas alkenigignens]|uniref:Uncharacterized protein n=1 Tax=Dehalogenimonas alkenigignens TaxID=1217799 RepID=A0A0W0GHE6_9CHLR|nr:hypothetical protein DEALK_08290 [Dehalogenimonas alkenigignens]PVV84246.1 hypothetical protein DD509_02815 [Dehalogenimonas alkenigignens]
MLTSGHRFLPEPEGQAVKIETADHRNDVKNHRRYLRGEGRSILRGDRRDDADRSGDTDAEQRQSQAFQKTAHLISPLLGHCL